MHFPKQSPKPARVTAGFHPHARPHPLCCEISVNLSGTTKVYSGVGADIVMESIAPVTRIVSVIACYQQLPLLRNRLAVTLERLLGANTIT
jgi:hypothetical protein